MTYKRFRYSMEFWPEDGEDFTEEQREVLDRAGVAAVEAAAAQLADSGIGHLAVGLFYEGEE